jgi:DNA-binding PadR family transcriptional regulator
MSEEDVVEELETRIVKTFLDVIVLQLLKEQGSAGAYDIISFLRERFGKTLSSGSVYSAIYAIQRRGLIAGVKEERKTIYRLTEKGEKTLDVIKKSEEELRIFRVGSFNIKTDLLK